MKFLPDKDKIQFDEEKHKYFLNGREFISVSRLIHLYVPPFDPTGEILTRCALKKGIPEKELREQWDFERDSACDRGHALHKEAEYWIDNGKIKKDGEYREVIKKIAKIPFKGELKSETIIYSEKYEIAGTVDIIEDLGGGVVQIHDFKQNKKLATKSFFTRGQGYSYMLYPLNHLMNCNFVHYSLQLEIYALILEENGYWVFDKNLIYIPPNTTDVNIFPILDLRKEAKIILNHFNF